MRELNLPEVPEEKKKPSAHIEIPKEPLAAGCAGIVSAWTGLIFILMAVILTAGLIRLAVWLIAS